MDMDIVERLRENADLDAAEHVPADVVQMQIDAANEIDGLRLTIAGLLEILRQWEPDNASGEDRRTIVLAMYQIGVLHDPTKTFAAMKSGARASDTPNA